jgi:5-formyltetrahydrofolate cyclo-ligase
MLFYDCDKHSTRIANALFDLDEWKSAGAINIYITAGNEVSTKDIIVEAFSTNKIIYHPAKKPEHNSSDIDLVVVPGVVFDVNMARYGRGLGYYDRFLSKLTNVKVIALAYDFQVSKKELKLDDWDIKMDYIITEKRVIQKKGYYFYN